MTPAQQAIAAKFAPMAWKRARYYARVWHLDPDDARAACENALFWCAREYDGRGEFSTLFWPVARFACASAVQKMLRDERRLKFSHPADDFQRCEAKSGTDPDAGPDTAVALGILSDRERCVIRWRFWDGMTLEECGRRLGCTKEWARVIEAKALERMKRKFR